MYVCASATNNTQQEGDALREGDPICYDDWHNIYHRRRGVNKVLEDEPM